MAFLMGKFVPRGKADIHAGNTVDLDGFAGIGQIGAVFEPAPDLPMMQLARLRTEHFFASAMHNNALFPDNPIVVVEFGAVARVCLPDWVQGDIIARPDAPSRQISMRQIASSLNSPAETTRRRLYELRDKGAVSISNQGVSLAATEENEARVRSYFLSMHDMFVRMIEDVHDTCDLRLPVSDEAKFTRQDVITRGIDTLLMQIDTHVLNDSSLPALYLWGAMCAVAVRRVTFDPVLSRRYADAIPPDEVRDSISLRRLAAALRIPYATVWRQVQQLQELGLVTRLRTERWTVLSASLRMTNMQNIRDTMGLSLIRKLRELAALGLDSARAAEYYAIGRPERADLGLEPAP